MACILIQIHMVSKRKKKKPRVCNRTLLSFKISWKMIQKRLQRWSWAYWRIVELIFWECLLSTSVFLNKSYKGTDMNQDNTNLQLLVSSTKRKINICLTKSCKIAENFRKGSIIASWCKTKTKSRQKNGHNNLKVLNQGIKLILETVSIFKGKS